MVSLAIVALKTQKLFVQGFAAVGKVNFVMMLGCSVIHSNKLSKHGFIFHTTSVSKLVSKNKQQEWI